MQEPDDKCVWQVQGEKSGVSHLYGQEKFQEDEKL